MTESGSATQKLTLQKSAHVVRNFYVVAFVFNRCIFFPDSLLGLVLCRFPLQILLYM